MKPANAFAFATGIVLLSLSHILIASSGYSTRDLNPILQPLYIPSHVAFSDENGWRFDHSFYITNTLQQEDKGGESLTIDVENYRYELGFRYRQDRWLVHANLPFIANSAGDLDGLIDDWHDFFGLPQGKRPKFPKNEIGIEYLRDGEVQYFQDRSSSGIGDLSVAVGYQLSDETRYFVGFELPTGSASEFSGNQAVDLAFWISRDQNIDEAMSIFGMLGLSFPGDDGNLENLTVDQIWVAQFGLDYRFTDNLSATLQFDLHSQTIDNSDLKAFGNSLQIQLGLGFPNLIPNHRLDLFFSEDILVGSAPDISFGLRLARGLN